MIDALVFLFQYNLFNVYALKFLLTVRQFEMTNKLSGTKNIEEKKLVILSYFLMKMNGVLDNFQINEILLTFEKIGDKIRSTDSNQDDVFIDLCDVNP